MRAATIPAWGLLLCVALPLHAADLDDLTWITTDGEVTITDCNEAATGALVLPGTIEGNLVTRIGDWAFYRCTSLGSVTLPGSVTNIGNNAFRECSNLDSVTLPEGVTSIGNSAFHRCTSLGSVTLPGSITNIGNNAFRECSNLASITIPDGVASIGPGAFYECSSLSAIEVGAGNVNYTDINGVLFNAEVTALIGFPAGKAVANYTVPEGVTSIREWAFYHCASLGSVTLPEGVASIGPGAFYGCSSLRSVTLPGSVTSIGNSTFRYCSSLNSVTLPGSVTSIGGSAFRNCTSLGSVTLPGSVTSIGGSAFRNCTSLSRVIFLGTAPILGADPFYNIATDAMVMVTDNFAESFGGVGTTWGELTVSLWGYTIDVATVGNGTVEGAGTFEAGSSVTLTATPEHGFQFVGWAGDATGLTNPLSLTSDGDMNIEAIFLDLASYGLVTQASYDAIVAERDARPTLEQVRDGRPGSVLLSVDSEAGSVTLNFTVEESEDLISWTPVEGPEVSKTLTLPESKRFYRFAH